MNKPHILLSSAVLFGALSLNAQTVLLDFGNTSSFRGADVTGSDTNGNYWNSVNAGAFFSNIVDTTGAATSYNFGFDGDPIPVGGSDYYNGPAGGTEDPDSVVVNSVALGILGGANEAVFDYYRTSAFQVQGFTAGQQVELTFFGSHKYNTENTTRYSTYSDTDYTTVLDFTDLVIGVGSAHNQDQTVSLTTIVGANGVIYVAFDGATGTGDGYLNAMSVAVVPEPGTYALIGGLCALSFVALRRRRA
jgi:hypothetical protein